MRHKLLKHFFYGALAIPFLYALWLLLRVCVFDYFTIPSESMMPTLRPGDKVVVNKLLQGGRIYKDFNFDKEGQELQSWRLKGLRGVQHNDICVFNTRIAFRSSSTTVSACGAWPCRATHSASWADIIATTTIATVWGCYASKRHWPQ